MKVFEQRHKITSAVRFFQAFDGMNLDNIQIQLLEKVDLKESKTTLSFLFLRLWFHFW